MEWAKYMSYSFRYIYLSEKENWKKIVPTCLNSVVKEAYKA